jgi:hypothetical protein
MRMRDLVIVVMLTACASRVDAAPIGTFEWTHDILFGTGSVFTVINESGSAFDDVTVDLFAPSAATPFFAASLGDLSPGESAQSFDDLSFFLVPFDLDSIRLRLTFENTLVTATLVSTQLTGDPSSLLAGSTTIDAPEVSPVPEPSSVLLLLTGVALLTRRRMTARQI